MKKCFLFVIFLFKFAAAQSLLPGDFVSTCAVGGYVVTKITFNSDGTFTTLTEGDLMYDSGKGTFSFKKDTIELKYDTSLHIGRKHWPQRLLMVDQRTLYLLDSENKIAIGGCFNGKDFFLQRDDLHIELPQAVLKERKVETTKEKEQDDVLSSKKSSISDTLNTIVFESWGMMKWGGIHETRYYKLCEDSLRRKYGFTYHIVAGCVATFKQDREWTRYNRKMERQMNKRFGKGWRDRYEKELQACIDNHR